LIVGGLIPINPDGLPWLNAITDIKGAPRPASLLNFKPNDSGTAFVRNLELPQLGVHSTD
jgi:hypothetical protein